MAMVNSCHACIKLVQQRSAIRQFPNKVKKQLRSTNGSCCALHLANRHFWSFLAPPPTRTLHCSCCFCCRCGPGLFTSFGLWGGGGVGFTSLSFLWFSIFVSFFSLFPPVFWRVAATDLQRVCALFLLHPHIFFLHLLLKKRRRCEGGFDEDEKT